MDTNKADLVKLIDIVVEGRQERSIPTDRNYDFRVVAIVDQARPLNFRAE